mmetsp:Transcript_28237/g.65392  ORF Transcript_28237/g.65392 Transcript_28237/m.65392 type:complete len:122 (-) Transcript_28237:251-616(-)
MVGGKARIVDLLNRILHAAWREAHWYVCGVQLLITRVHESSCRIGTRVAFGTCKVPSRLAEAFLIKHKGQKIENGLSVTSGNGRNGSEVWVFRFFPLRALDLSCVWNFPRVRAKSKFRIRI